ncbi:ArsR/SmtB family transcription factor [Anaerocolumna sp. MB42-C2]|uniref:ArsR/SmtB family transcription factor n=1 Tax=Anaerocolumna sp. MB42-C2 TaxID=3070997 RepID=UPI0027E20B52|nr:winged helix-turn-helix domain-containing protein [Anaerocolumna sp. MB42-C2]WMJ90498.1 winged helix-turn-helix domain-containing protein [Anaerocolumna sp. MB42-C2]
MQVTVKKEINYVEEANNLLFYYANSISYEEMKQKGYGKFDYSKELYKERYDLILKIYYYVTENMRFEKDKLDFYFKELGNSKMSISNYLLPIYSAVQFCTLKEYEEDAKGKSGSQIIKEFDDILSQYYYIGESGEERKAESFEDLVRCMDTADLSTEDKWKIVQVYLEREKHIEEVCSILKGIIKLLKECRNEVKKLETEFYEYWTDYMCRADLLKELQDYTNIRWKYNEEGTYILPTIFMPQSISFSIKDENENKPDVIRLGVILDSNLYFKPAEVNSEKLNNVLKLLSDKSKFEILKYIKDKPAYGFEIANAFNLSTSTISYHMKSLITENLIKLEKDANKIYYSLNKDNINKLLEDIRQMLL